MLSTWFLKLFRDEHGIQMLEDLFVNISIATAFTNLITLLNFALTNFTLQSEAQHGLYGKNEDGEHTQKIVKEHYYKWMNKK